MSYHRSQPVYLPGRRFSRGLGDAASTAKNVSIGGSFLGSGVTAVLPLLGLSNLVPIVGPILAAATMGIQALIANSGCGPTCVATSQWANQAAGGLQQVMDGYFAIPAPRTNTQKAIAISNFNAVWSKLQELCGQPGTGNAGVRCISDRQAGACTWKQKYAPTYPGQPNIGECWNWFNGYLKPIQDDVTVPDPETSVSDSITSVFGSSAPSVSSLLPLAAIAALVFWGSRL